MPAPQPKPKAMPLPATAQAVADVIGREKTIKLAQACRFRSFYVPFELSERHWLARTIGYASARRLQEEFPGMQLPLAKCRDIALADRNARIVEAARKGTPKPVIADLLRVSLRTVQDVVARDEMQQARTAKPMQQALIINA